MFPFAKSGLGLLTTLALACAACGDPEESRVPYQQPQGEEIGSTGQDPGLDSPQWEPTRGRPFAPGTRRATMDGAEFTAEGRELRAALTVDTDGDHMRDLLALTRAPDGGVALLFSRRRGDSFSGVQTLRQSAAPQACTLTGTELETLTPTIAIARFGWACPDLGESEVVPKPPSHVLWLIRLGLHPRLGEEIVIPEGGDHEAGMRLEVSIEPPGEAATPTDLAIQITAEVGAQGSRARLAMQWHDRVSGLVLDRESLTQSIEHRARRARRSLRRDPARALAEANDGLALVRSLCRGHEPRIEVAGVSGLPCSEDAPFTSLVATGIAALVGDGDLVGALKREMEFRLSGRSPPEEVDAFLADAWESATGATDYRWRPVGEVHGLTARNTPRPTRLTFLDEGTLLVHTPQPQVLSLASGLSAPFDTGAGSPPPASWISSPLNPNLVVHPTVRTCDGYRLVVGPVQSPPLHRLRAETGLMPLLEARAPLARARCNADPGTVRVDDGGWRILGWAARGLVAARLDALRLIPVDDAGRGGVGPTPITRPGAWLGTIDGSVQSGGHAYVYVTTRGLLLQHLGDANRTELIRPPPQANVPQPLFDPAIAPSGHRIAILGPRRIWLIESADAPPIEVTPNLMPAEPAGR